MRVVHQNGRLVMTVRYLLKKPDGSLWYQRRVPVDLRYYYGKKARILESLKTKDPIVAARLVQTKATRDDRLWSALRSQKSRRSDEVVTKAVHEQALALLNEVDLEDYLDRKYPEFPELRYSAAHGSDVAQSHLETLLSLPDRHALDLLVNPKPKAIYLSDCVQVYLETHKNGSKPYFKASVDRAIRHVIDTIGDLEITQYTRSDARFVRDTILKTVKTATARRRLNTVVAVVNRGLLEFQLQTHNVFAKIEIKDEALDAKVRQPFTQGELETIAKACLEKDDDLRWIVTLQLETGARLGEIVGLRLEDLVLAEIPYVWIRPHLKHGRTLKTPQSERKVPLVGLALWAAQRVLQTTTSSADRSSWLFPRYASDTKIKGDGCSASLCKWLKHLGISKSTHSARHSMKDRLRAARVPEDIQKAILGHGSRSVADGYGQGYPLEVLRESLSLVSLSL
jgi:integrase